MVIGRLCGYKPMGVEDSKQCALCGKHQGRIDRHHLTYSPDKIVYLCAKHHHLLHNLAELNLSQREVLYAWVKGFGHLWINCTEQFYQSESRREFHRLSSNKTYHKYKDKYKEYSKKYRTEHKEEIKQKGLEYRRRPEIKEKINLREKIRRMAKKIPF